MFKKLLLTALAIGASFVVASTANAADVYQTIEINEGQYPNINFYPRALHVNQGDTLHLTVRNTRQGYTSFFMPAFNLEQEIAADDVAKFDLCIANPVSKVMQFQISSLNGKRIPGYLVTNNYTVPIVDTTPRVINTALLDDIIHYSNDYCYLDKPEPKYGAHRRHVRGYW